MIVPKSIKLWRSIKNTLHETKELLHHEGVRADLRTITVKFRRYGIPFFLVCATLFTASLAVSGIHFIYFDRTNLPDLHPFIKFDLPTIGHVYDVNDKPLIEMASEYRGITKYKDIPPVIRDAILSAEDKNFFSHSGIDYTGIARGLFKLRILNLMKRLTNMGDRNAVNNSAIFPQGGSTITQQLLRGYFLKAVKAQENSDQLRHDQITARFFSYLIGARTVNMFFRKSEEIRLSLWMEEEMEKYYGSKRFAKEEILARYVSMIYMGNGQYGFGRGAQYYFGRPLSTFTQSDVDKAALLAGSIKSPRNYSPTSRDSMRVLDRRNQILSLMMANNFISREQAKGAMERPIDPSAQFNGPKIGVSAVVESVLEELKRRRPDITVSDIMQGNVQLYSTVNSRLQQISNQALEQGLQQYEKRYPQAEGLIQGSVVVLRNSDASILAETGGRQFYKNRSSALTDFNRVTKAFRQPGSTMKPIVYLAAFQKRKFTLNTLVFDDPISIRDGDGVNRKKISNYDGKFKGAISIRRALAESRNAATIWVANQIGVSNILTTAHKLGIMSRLHAYTSTALGASEVTLLELANAYRTIASGILSEPYVLRKAVLITGEVIAGDIRPRTAVEIDSTALTLIQEGLRSVVRMRTGTAHTLSSREFPLQVMGKTGTTNEFRDALFVGSTYGPEGITVAVRIFFDDNRSLGEKETGGRLAMPVFREIMLNVYREGLAGSVPKFPSDMEQRITVSMMKSDSLKTLAEPVVQTN